jgi:acyl carrier protein
MGKPSGTAFKPDHPGLSIPDRVIAMVHEKLAKHGFDRTVSHDDDLREIGLSSLDMVNLMLRVEAAYDLQIPDADMTLENFRSVARIEKLVVRLLGTS